MAGKHFTLTKIESPEYPAVADQLCAFEQNFQTALLLSLLDRGLLDQMQFDRCLEAVEKTKEFKNNSCLHGLQA